MGIDLKKLVNDCDIFQRTTIIKETPLLWDDILSELKKIMKTLPEEEKINYLHSLKNVPGAPREKFNVLVSDLNTVEQLLYCYANLIEISFREILERLKNVPISEEDAEKLYNLAVDIDIAYKGVERVFRLPEMIEVTFKEYLSNRNYVFIDFVKEDKTLIDFIYKRIELLSNEEKEYLLNFVRKTRDYILNNLSELVGKSGNKEIISCFAYDFPDALSEKFLENLVTLKLVTEINRIWQFYEIEENVEALKYLFHIISNSDVRLENRDCLNEEILKRILNNK